jgi:acyl carrier protein
MKTVTNLIHLITGVLAEARKSPVVTMESSFADLGMCAVDHVCVAREVEERYSIDLPDAEVDNWTCVADVAATLAKWGKI